MAAKVGEGVQDIRDFEPLWGEWSSVELLGQGTFGRVYKMVKRDLGKEYYSAVKHLSLPSEPGEEKELYSEGLVTDQKTLKTYYEGVLKKLRSEIDLCYKLKGNTNIVSYEDHCVRDKDSGVGYDIFIKMELLTGLQDRIREGGLTDRDVVKLGEDICKALTVLRREKIVHRDIKPGNIFVNSGGDYKLGDFGVSRTMERTVNSMSVQGTFNYMAPEAAQGGGGDYLADLYSLGLVLYRLLNKNRAPFLPPPLQSVTHEMSMQAQERRLRGDELPPPSDADEEMAAIILKACAYHPGDRWESAEEMGQALANYRRNMRRSEEAVPDGGAEEDAPTELLGRTLRLEAGSDEPTETEDKTPIEPRKPVEKPPEPKPNPKPAPKPAPKTDAKVPVIAAGACAVVLVGAVCAFALKPKPSEAPPPPSQSVLLPSSASIPLADPAPILWQDPVIRDGVLAALNTDGENLTPEMLAGLEELILSVPDSDAQEAPEPAHITTLTDLSMLTGLKTLEFSGRPVDTFDFPENMPSLGMLKMDGCGCTDLDFFSRSRFPELQSLDLRGNEITDLTPLANLTGLIELNISQTAAVSLEPLGGLSKLTFLWAEDIPAEDWSFVERVAQVEGRPEEPDEPDEPQTPVELQKPSEPQKPSTEQKPNNKPSNSTTTKPATTTPTTPTTTTPTTPTTTTPTTPTTTTPTTPATTTPTTPTTATPTTPTTTTPTTPTTTTPTTPTTTTPTTPTTPSNSGAAETTTPTVPTPPEPVKVDVSSVSVSPPNIMLEVGGSTRLSASVSPTNATNQKVSWSSSNPSVATVDGSGNVRAVDRGTARITASCDGKSGFCTITVD